MGLSDWGHLSVSESDIKTDKFMWDEGEYEVVVGDVCEDEINGKAVFKWKLEDINNRNKHVQKVHWIHTEKAVLFLIQDLASIGYIGELKIEYLYDYLLNKVLKIRVEHDEYDGKPKMNVWINGLVNKTAAPSKSTRDLPNFAPKEDEIPF